MITYRIAGNIESLKFMKEFPGPDPNVIRVDFKAKKRLINKEQARANIIELKFDHEKHIYYCDILDRIRDEEDPNNDMLKLKVYLPDNTFIIGWQNIGIIDLDFEGGDPFDGRYNKDQSVKND